MLLRVFLLSFSPIGAKAVTCIEQMVSGTDKALMLQVVHSLHWWQVKDM